MRDIKTIFVIDDDPIMRFGMRKMLSKISIKSEVFEFNNGQLGLEEVMARITSNKVLPEVIFLDINMPILNGWDFLEEFIRLEIKERILINIITSSIDPNDREKWLSFRAKTNHHIDFVNKPIYKIELNDLHKMDLAS
ncbi:two-component system response regulator [Croceitalea marina]|uniref:Two-component system response regulator n=1 Tax=Croceitalea marina TaxID=1775166 RepID=A0ABW5MRK8_9FLAO